MAVNQRVLNPSRLPIPPQSHIIGIFVPIELVTRLLIGTNVPLTANH